MTRLQNIFLLQKNFEAGNAGSRLALCSTLDPWLIEHKVSPRLCHSVNRIAGSFVVPASSGSISLRMTGTLWTETRCQNQILHSLSSGKLSIVREAEHFQHINRTTFVSEQFNEFAKASSHIHFPQYTFNPDSLVWDLPNPEFALSVQTNLVI